MKTYRVVRVYLRNVGTDEDECWTPCARTDDGAVAFEATIPIKEIDR